MATLYDSASLVMIPSGFKESKLYSIKPTDGSGDFTFSRGTDTATRVNASGLIEKERGNLITYSNDFSQWSDTTIVLTSGQSGYDGSSDAWLMAKNGSNSRIFTGVTTSGVTITSIYAKANASNYLRIRLDTTGATSNTYFDLANGSVHSTNDSIYTNIESVGNGWYRCSVVPNDPTTIVRLYPAEAGSTSATSGSIYIQDAQLEQGLVATDYIETTSAAVYEGITDNLPRLDYSGGASCPSLLLEPSRTNLVLQSEYIGSSWNPFGNISITTNAATSPEGVQNATEISATSTTTAPIAIQDGLAVTANTDYTISFFAKKGDFRYIQLFHGSNQVTSNARTNFDIQEGVVAYEESGVVTANVEDYGNGWYRCTATMEALLTTLQAYIAVAPTADAARGSSISATAGENYYIYGIQMEAGTYPTSYIPTYGTSASRAADNCDLVILSLGLTMIDGGTFFFDFVNNDFPITGTNKPTIQLASSAYANYLGAVGKNLNGDGNLAWSAGYSVSNAYTLPTAETRYKCAFKWDNTNLKIFVNGSQVYSTTSFTSAEYNTINLNYADRKAITEINQVLLFDEQLTDAECIALTTI